MNELLVGAVGFAFGALAAWLARADTIHVLTVQLDNARAAEAIATDRMVHAAQAGAIVPPRPLPTPPPLQPLPSILRDELQQWEDPEHRIVLEGQMRNLMARGMDATAVLLTLDNQHP